MAAPTLLVVTGLAREARIAASDGVISLCSGGDPNLLRERLSKLYPARSREGGDPEPGSLDARLRGNERIEPPSSFETRPSGAPQDKGGDGLALPVRGILSFGLTGGLAPDLKPGDVVLATHVTAGDKHYEVAFDWHDAMASKLEGAVRLHRGLIAGMDTVLSKAADKVTLHAISGALAVDMESHLAAAFAHRYGLPFAALRTVSDPAARSLPEIAAHALRPDGTIDLARVLGGVARNPGQMPAMVAAGIDSERAFASLRRCRRLLGPLFGFRSANF